MKVSIITVCFNSERHIRSAIESVWYQTYRNIEYIVVDGGSTDTTPDILRSYEAAFAGRMRWISEPDNGLYDAMNKGIAMASGDVVGLLNSDDLYADNNVIASVAACFEASPCDAIYGDLIYVAPDNVAKIKRYWQAGPCRPKRFLYGWMPPHPTFFVRAAIYRKYGRFRTDFKSAADYELMLRLLYKEKINVAYLPAVLVKMRTGGTSNAGIGSRLKGNREDRKAWKVNHLKPYFFTLLLKPIRKIPQYFKRGERLSD
jgi:glycosyltransferase involved in cell wall biosynthesis